MTAGTRSAIATFQEHNGNKAENEPTYSRDADWLDRLPECPVSFREVTGGETIRGRQMEAHTVALLTVPYSPTTRGIHQKMRVLINGRKLNIVSVLDLEGKRRELAIQVAEAAA